MLANILHIKEKIINDIKQFFEQNEKPRINFSWSISKCIVQNVVILKDNGQFSSVAQACLTLCDPMDCCTPGFPVHYQLLELTQTHVHWVSDAILPSHRLSSPFPPTFSLSQHQGLIQWVSSPHQLTKVLEFQPQHQSFQWIFRTNFL